MLTAANPAQANPLPLFSRLFAAFATFRGVFRLATLRSIQRWRTGGTLTYTRSLFRRFGAYCSSSQSVYTRLTCVVYHTLLCVLSPEIPNLIVC
jgi:hypothetical protein